MDFDWTTFFLEIINFLVLIWILKRFLYQPVLNIIDKRRAGIDQAMADAQRIEAEANALKQKNEQYLTEWENEKEAAHAKLAAELAEIRKNKLAELNQKFDEETERRQILDERRRSDYEKKVEEMAIAQGAKFVSKLLSRLATPELESQLFKLLLDDLSDLGESDKRAISEAIAASTAHILVQSAFPLSNTQKQTLSAVLTEAVHTQLPIEYQCNDTLLAGFQIAIGPWVLHANLRDELKFFSSPLQHEK
ncbi:F0F1 ATP synthase subunit delta [Nitrosomonas sp.]|uniref:F0F1 ATP synthase subunit delta n=1 Tax=Nitrosomonas sp. TaxID=42353 RepID=UPI001D82FAE0|nr:F0F1 ATP synthase subunit delta [Nitrosomonas sp.]MCB1948207.1 F0F1 ATP synthase subunit delta [Nitrosomonas sp.]MDR4513792.1 F0F1 ATP synthase subunit delta [Nitrosomonas sp.]